jgi:hypothetical protein
LLKVEALTITREIANRYSRAAGLGALVPYLPEVLRAELLAETLQAVRGSGDKYESVSMLCALAPQLPDQAKSDVLAVAREIEHEPQQATGAGIATHVES